MINILVQFMVRPELDFEQHQIIKITRVNINFHHYKLFHHKISP